MAEDRRRFLRFRPGGWYIESMMNRRTLAWLGLCIALIVPAAGCGQGRSGIAYQNSTIDALLDGNYDGEVTFGQLRKHGDFGIGTFDSLDGEMIAIDGRFYQVRSDGQVHVVPPEMRTPFSVVTFFKPADATNLSAPLTYPALKQRLDALRPADGHAYAFAIDGAFDRVRTRSVPRQQPPYSRLEEVVKSQPTFELTAVRGTLVGFWFPESMRHINVPGYHFHFLTDDRSAGGHVLDLTLREGTARMQLLSTVQIALPRTPPTTQPRADYSDALERVEK